MRPRLRPLVLLPLLAAPAAAQHVVLELPGAAAGDNFGGALAGGRDVTGDGVPDLVVGAERADVGAANAGRVEVRSGASGGLALALDGAAAGDGLGASVGLSADLDGDGRADLVVGVPFDDAGAWNAGAALVVSGASGATVHPLIGGTQFGLLGSAVAACGDVDGDLVPDAIVGAPEDDPSGDDSGLVVVLSGATGGGIFQKNGASAGDRMGRAVAGAGDVDGDGLSDVVVGADQEDAGALTDAGVVRVWSVQSGALLLSKSGSEAGARLGFAVAGVGDLDGDGRGDVAAGAFGASPNGPSSGRVTVWSGATGATLLVIEGASAGDELGWSVAGVGDVDGDGVPEMLVGAPGEDQGRGAARLVSGATGALLAVTHGAAPGDRLGESVCDAGDLDGDGRSEWAAGAPFADAAGADAGLVLVLSSTNPAGLAYCFGDGSGAPCPCGNTGGPGEGCASSTGAGARLDGRGSPSVASDTLVLDAAGLVPGQPALCFAGLNAVNGGLGVAFGDGLRCAGGAIQRVGVQTAAGGAASFGPGLAAQEGWQPGDLVRFQVWYRDPLQSACGTGFNLSNGFEVLFQP